MNNLITHVMGNDGRVVSAARVSYNLDKKVKPVERDIKLINFLVKHRHASPFEHCIVVLNNEYPVTKKILGNRMFII